MTTTAATRTTARPSAWRRIWLWLDALVVLSLTVIFTPVAEHPGVAVRTLVFWIWFVIATAALARLWNTVEGGLFVRFGPADAVAVLVLLIAVFVLGRVQYRAAREGRK